MSDSTIENAIRQARKNYQAADTMPDWEALAQAVQAGRQTSP